MLINVFFFFSNFVKHTSEKLRNIFSYVCKEEKTLASVISAFMLIKEARTIETN